MSGVNKWIGVGNLTSDPETKKFDNGDSITNVTIACNEKYYDKSSGEKKETVEFVRLVLKKNASNFAEKYLKKGDQVYIEGTLKTRSWEKDGERRYVTEVHSFIVQALGGKSQKSGEEQTNDTGSDLPF